MFKFKITKYFIFFTIALFVILLIFLVRVSIRPIDITFLKDYVEKNSNISTYLSISDVKKIQARVNLLSNKVIFDLGKLSVINFNNKVKNFTANNITLDVLLTDLIFNKPEINSLNIIGGKATLLSNKINKIKDFNNVKKINLTEGSDFKLGSIKYLGLKNFFIKFTNDLSTVEIKSNIDNAILSLENGSVIIDSLLLKNIEYINNLEKINLTINNIILSSPTYNNYLISMKEISLSKDSSYFKKMFLDLNTLKIKNCKIKLNAEKKDLDLLAEIYEEGIVLPLKFKGNIEKNFSITGILEGKISKNNILSIINKKKLLDLGLDIKNLDNGYGQGSFKAKFFQNKIDNVEFNYKHNTNSYEKISFLSDKIKKIELNINNFFISGKYEKNRIKVLDMNVLLEDGKISAYGDIINISSSAEYDLVVTLHNFILKDFDYFKNFNFNYNIDKNLDNLSIKEAKIENFVLEVSKVKEKLKINSLYCELKDIIVRLNDNLEIFSPYLNAAVDDERIEITAQKILLSDNKKSSFLLENNNLTVNQDNYSFNNYDLNFRSKISSKYKDLRKISGQIKYLKLDEYFLKSLDGNLEANLEVNSKKNKDKKSLLNIKATGNLKNFNTLSNPAYALSMFNGKFKITNDQILIEGKGELNGSEASISMNINKEKKLEAEILSTAKFSSFDFLNEFNFLNKGTNELRMVIVKENLSSDNWTAFIESDLNNSGIEIDIISHKKLINANGQFKADFYFKNFTLTEIKNLNYATDDILIHTDMKLDINGKIDEVLLKQFINKNNNFKAEIKNLLTDKRKIIISGESFDFKNPPFKSNNKQIKNHKIDFSISNMLYGKNNFGYTQFQAELFGKEILFLSGFLEKNKVIHTNFSFKKNTEIIKDEIEVKFDDFGLFLKTVGVTDDFLNGKGILKLKLKKNTQSVLSGSYNIDNFSIKNASFLTRILQLASFTGLLEILGNDGIPFQKLSGNFDKKNNLIFIENTKFEGISLGATVKGELNTKDKNIKLDGVLVPAYAINSIINKIPLIGEIVTGIEGEGIIGVKYKAEGHYENPKYSINPFSLFTPGILRNLFEPYKGEVENNLKEK